MKKFIVANFRSIQYQKYRKSGSSSCSSPIFSMVRNSFKLPYRFLVQKIKLKAEQLPLPGSMEV